MSRWIPAFANAASRVRYWRRALRDCARAAPVQLPSASTPNDPAPFHLYQSVGFQISTSQEAWDKARQFDMEIDEHIAIVRREGERLADVAGQTSFDAEVGTCPGWTIRDLVRHVGGIHSWATAHVSKSRSGRFDPFEELEGRWPSDDALLEWFRAGHHKLVSALESAPDDLECFTFLKAPSARAFWARRQAHETGMHRADAESAGTGITPFAPEQAVDGIDELLFGFMARPGQRFRTEDARVLQLSATDAAAAWQVRTSQDEPVVRRGLDGEADLRVTAAASDLFLLVWNRRAQDGLDVVGDTSLLDLWRQSVFVRWR